MNLREIEAFQSVMLTGSVTAAAEQLRVTQPTISKLIALLERRTKLKLFDRRHSRLIPRPEARLFLRDVERVMLAVEKAGLSARLLAGNHSGHIRIGEALTFGSLISKAISTFLRDHQEVKISIHSRASSYVREWVAGQISDIGFIAGDGSAKGIETCFQRNHPSAVCVISRESPLARKPYLMPEDFEGLRVISMGRDHAFREAIDGVFKASGIRRNVAVECNHLGTACSMVAENIGVVISDPYSAFPLYDTGKIVLRRFLPAIPFTMSVVKCANVTLPLVVEDFLEVVEAEHAKFENELERVLTPTNS